MYGIGPALGMYDDLSNNDKTVGEAVAHNGTSLALAIGTGAVVSAVGAPVVAGLAVGAGLGLLFEASYNRNWLGIQTGLDKAGEAISSGLSKLNPVNWAW